MQSLFKNLLASAVTAVVFSGAALAAPIQFSVTYNVEKVTPSPGPLLLSAFQPGQEYKGTITFDDSALATDGFHVTEIAQFTSILGANFFNYVPSNCVVCTGLRDESHFKLSTMGLLIQNHTVIGFDHSGIYDAGDRTYIDFFPQSSGYGYLARLDDRGALTDVAGSLAFSQVPEPGTTFLVLLGLLGAVASPLKSRASRR